MKNTFGSSVCVTLFGESHGPCVGAVLDGMAPGIDVDETEIAQALSLRRPQKDGLSTARCETDAFTIESGVYRGKTTGTPIVIRIPNTAQHSADYADYGIARPGHADVSAWEKYHGYEDPRGGGHFSGRITAGLVAVGAIARAALRRNGIEFATHMKLCAGISDREFGEYSTDFAFLNNTPFPVLDSTASEAMKREISTAREAGDSVGGVLETAVCGFPCGVGEPWFDSVESVLSHLLFSVPAVKGVEFGDGFGLCSLRGSEANDPWRIGPDGRPITETNRNGGINGGITNGMPILFRCAVKPTPSIFVEQKSVNFRTGEDLSLSLAGRHDPCIVHRARAAVDAVTALGLCDLLALRFGTDRLGGGKWNSD